jgi:Tol biopolymer transport system component
MDEPPFNQNSSNFWAARIDLSTGRFVGTPARITSGDGFVVKPSITADGKRLVFNRAKPQVDVYVSEFSSKGPRLSTPRRLALDDPAAWRQSLLYVDLAGHAHQLWQVDSIWPSWAIPSRNGKYLAIPAPTVDSNVWMAENF